MADLSALLAPETVAIIGASPDHDTLRGRIMKVMGCHDFAGRIYPVSRSHDEIDGLKTYASIAEVPERVDLAVVIIPAQFVLQALRDCGEAEVGAAQILTSGFAEEPGGAGRAMQDEIRAIAAEYDMAITGPNAEGAANLRTGLCTTFSPAVDEPSLPLMPDWRSDGFVSVVAQSGGVGFAFYDHGRPKHIPFNQIVTTGNEAALEAFDIVDHLIDRDESEVFIVFLEDVKTAGKFVAVAEKALRAGKPIIVAKIGESEAGVRAAASHTAALAGSHAAYRALFQRYAIIEGREIGEMVDIAQAFSLYGHKLPAGRRVGICTSSGGSGGWMADACAAAGLEVPELDAATRAAIDVHLPAYGTSQNPVDATAQAIRKVGHAALSEMVAGSPKVDAVIAITTARSRLAFDRDRENLARVSSSVEKPIVFASYTQPTLEAAEIVSRLGYPLFANFRHCATTLRHMADYRETREAFLKAPIVSTARHPAADTVHSELKSAGAVLCEHEVKPLLAQYGIAVSEERLVQSAEDAVASAREIGRPVVLKLQSPDILHKSDAGLVALNLEGAEAVAGAFSDLIAKAKAHDAAAAILGVLVQAMAPAGQEMILGVNHDQTFGPMLMVGLGGVHVEVLADVALAPVPISDAQARSLLDRLQGRALLDGVRGAPPADIDALVGLMAALSRFAADQGDLIGELDLNPVIVHSAGGGVSLVDALLLKRTTPS